ncbi:50S ribosomal protein L20 [Patella vulgata]|uniref:50S ribosomal protein L20 n=1 Tax=Patella vulgata TaxID=6465 RepID=UPI00217FB6C8|nr:50S ribosomal protein L20 [Patella vulgata]
MFLTFLNFASRQGGADIQWKRHMYKRIAWSYYGRKRNCFRLSIRTVERALRYSTNSGKPKREFYNNIVKIRLEAACWEHGVLYDEFLKTLDESSIQLNRTTLQHLAIYEPRTFQSLCDFTVKRQGELGLKAATATTPSGVLTRGML